MSICIFIKFIELSDLDEHLINMIYDVKVLIEEIFLKGFLGIYIYF